MAFDPRGGAFPRFQKINGRTHEMIALFDSRGQAEARARKERRRPDVDRAKVRRDFYDRIGGGKEKVWLVLIA